MSRLELGPLLLLSLMGCPNPTETKTTDDTAPEDTAVNAVDEDGDGFLPSDGDCDDSESAINPSAVEVCDGLDNNCDSQVDEGVATFYYVDADLDGFGDDATAKGYCEPAVGLVTVAGDCDDADPDFHPNAEEPCTTDIDYNCDGVTEWADDDTDGFALCEDCNDLDPAVNPDATEVCNGIDDDCDGEADPTSSFDVVPFYADGDGDGYGDISSTTDACAAPPGYVSDTTDCDDGRADVNPGMTELCDTDNVDENCDTLADDDDPGVDITTYTAWYRDADADTFGLDSTMVEQCDAPTGWIEVGGDCNDYSTDFYPGAPEADCSDPNDYNCDGSVAYTDADGDAWAACIECDDSNAAINPAAVEMCNGVDDNCDGLTDPDSAADSLTWYADTDGDTFGDASVSAPGCAAPSGYVADATDCDDTDGLVFPGGAEVCNGIDDDCDAVIDPSTSLDAATWFADTDGDTFGDAGNTTPACTQPAGYVTDATDCVDTDAAIFPGATELCNGLDDDCDAVIDPPSAFDAQTWYADTDGDTYGDPAITTLDCANPAGYSADNTDCDDTRLDVNPGAPELCDAANTDENCNGLADDLDSTTDPTSMSTTYADVDGDGYGNPAASDTGCESPSGYIADNTDCNDARSGVHPGATEYCDALDVDEDCDGLADDDDPTVDSTTFDTWYQDYDGDSYGSTVTIDACDLPSGYAGSDGDCDDYSAAVNPDAEEVCDSLDNDCDGTVDYVSGSDVCWSGVREFDNCSATGYTGPTQSACDTSYSGTTLDGEVTVSSGIQSWTVPTTGDYVIDAYGGMGYAGQPTVHGGYGAHALGTYSLTAGDVLYIVVGQKGTGGNNSGGGGGGSFVVLAPSTPLVIAGGGGGTRNAATSNGCDGRSGQYGGSGSGYSSSSTCAAKGGSLGLGGVISSVSWGSGGAGFNGDGYGERTYVSSSWGGDGGLDWAHGMTGGMGNATCGRADGGFGGGGSGNGCWGGGGGGGYSGGDGGLVAGGGGSYVDSSGTSTATTAGVNAGVGYVTIDML